MAIQTETALRNQVLYSVYVRNHTPEGTFQALRGDLQRIRDLGVDIIWLMPIHPIGTKARKGSLGSPYAISDYRAVNPEYGTMEDFKALVADIHGLGMKCIIDVVYNHTSPDSKLVAQHPEWFYHKPDGSFGNHVGDWSDIVDLDYTNRELWDYQIETLKQWATIVDGFRCDVAPMLPMAFWQQARRAVETVRPGCIWLSESIEPGFITYLRGQGLTAHTDEEVFEVFDIAYDYDIWGVFNACVRGEVSLSVYAQAVNEQQVKYPHNYIKLRYLENHDNDRAAHIIPNLDSLRSWTAFMYFQQGMPLLFGGQEAAQPHRPDLFNRDTVSWDTGIDLTELLKALAAVKKQLPKDGAYHVEAVEESVLVANYENTYFGAFPVKGGAVVTLPCGVYENLLTGENLTVTDGRLFVEKNPVLLVKN